MSLSVMYNGYKPVIMTLLPTPEYFFTLLLLISDSPVIFLLRLNF